MDTSPFKTIGESFLNYVVETNKQVYDFNMKVTRDYVEFSKSTMKLIPGFDSLAQLVPSFNTKK